MSQLAYSSVPAWARTQDVTPPPSTDLLAAGAPASDLVTLLDRVSIWHRRRSLVVLITDTAHPGPDAATWLRRLSRTGVRSAPPPNQRLVVTRKRVFMCTAGTCGFAMCATRLMPVAKKRGSSPAPWMTAFQ